MTLENLMKVVVLVVAVLFHYNFILSRMKTANEEAIKVLENLPDTESQ